MRPSPAFLDRAKTEPDAFVELAPSEIVPIAPPAGVMVTSTLVATPAHTEIATWETIHAEPAEGIV